MMPPWLGPTALIVGAALIAILSGWLMSPKGTPPMSMHRQLEQIEKEIFGLNDTVKNAAQAIVDAAKPTDNTALVAAITGVGTKLDALADLATKILATLTPAGGGMTNEEEAAATARLNAIAANAEGAAAEPPPPAA